MSNPVLAEAIGTPDGALTDFLTASPYYAGTVFCYINGLLIRKSDDDGIIEIGGNLIRHKIAPRTGDTVHYYYQEGPPTGGAIQGPPDMLQAFELYPKLYQAIDLRPKLIDAVEDTTQETPPQMVGNKHLVPEMATILNLRPELIPGGNEMQALDDLHTLDSIYYRYADVDADPGGNGHIHSAYNKIQDAIDDIEAAGDPTRESPGVVYIQDGTYDEALVIRKDHVHLIAKTMEGRGRRGVRVISSTLLGWSITFTNATKESLDAYNISGSYADLVNQGNAGPSRNMCVGISFTPDGAGSSGGARFLGVKGDDTTNTTNFGASYITFYNCVVDGQGSTVPSIYIKNCGRVSVYHSFIPSSIIIENGFGFDFWYATVASIISTYDATSVDGRYKWAQYHGGYLLQCVCDDYYNVDWVMDGGRPYVYFYGTTFGFFGTTPIIYQNTIGGVIEVINSNGPADITVDGDTAFTVRSSSIDGNITLGSGPGVTIWQGGGWTGTLIDPDNKLKFISEKRFIYPNIITTTYTAKFTQRLRYDTSSGSFTINAPVSPKPGYTFAVKEIVGDATPVTVSGNGYDIEHPITGVVASTAVFGQARIAVTWEFDGTSWIIV